MKNLLPTLFLGLLAILSLPAALGQVSQASRIQASYMLGFGRMPTSAEQTYWLGKGALSLKQLLASHTAYLGTDPATNRATITQSYIDALGRQPTGAELSYWSAGHNTYAVMMNNNVTWLRGNPTEYQLAIERSYLYEFGRYPSQAEVNYWKGGGVYSYLALVGCHSQYISQYGKGGNATAPSGTCSGTCAAMVRLPVSPALAQEALAATSIISHSGSPIILIGGSNLVASGAGNLVASGAGNLVASGAGNIVAAGAGNVMVHVGPY